MKEDLVVRLRRHATGWLSGGYGIPVAATMREAATCIEVLRRALRHDGCSCEGFHCSEPSAWVVIDEEDPWYYCDKCLPDDLRPKAVSL